MNLRQRCSECGQVIPVIRREPTERELDLLMAWRASHDLRKAAVEIGVGYQRAKNMLARCRNRSGVETNEALVQLHMDLLLSRAMSATSQNSRMEAA